jgi:hypothetical protein
MFGFGKKNVFRDGDYIFSAIGEGDYNRIVVGLVEFGGPGTVKVAGLHFKPVGLIQKVQSGKLGPRSTEVLRSPTPDNVIHMLIDKVESGDFHDYIDVERNVSVKIGAKRYTEIDNWIREGFPELFSIILSQTDPRKEEAKQAFMDRMNAIHDPELKKTVYGVARQLKIF